MSDEDAIPKEYKLFRKIQISVDTDSAGRRYPSIRTLDKIILPEIGTIEHLKMELEKIDESTYTVEIYVPKDS